MTDRVKPWKIKRKQTNLPKTPDVELFESKPMAIRYGLKATDILDYVCVTCGPNFEFIIPFEVVKSFNSINSAFSRESYREHQDKHISFPEIDPDIMEIVIRYAFNEYINRLKNESIMGKHAPTTVFQFDIDPSKVMELISAAHFLGHKGLLDLCTAMVADNISDVPDLSTLPVEYAEPIIHQMSAQNLLIVDERADFHSLGIDLEPIWMKLCTFLRDEPTFYPLRDPDGISPPSWKSAYVTHVIQALANRQTGSSTVEYFAEIERYGRHVFAHRIMQTVLADIISPMGELGLLEYVSHFENLSVLILKSLNLCWPAEVTGQLLKVLPRLQILDMGQVGLQCDDAISLGKELSEHCRLQELRLPHNDMRSLGLEAIFRSLPSAKTMRVLDVNCNNFRLSICDDAAECLEASSLEELLCDGGADFSRARAAWFSTAGGQAVQRTIRSREPANRDGLVVSLLSRFPSRLKQLSMRNRGLNDSHVLTLIRGLQDHQFLQVLNLGENHISSVGANVLFSWLMKNTSLQTLQLDHNNVNDDCVPTMVGAISSHPSLKQVSLFSNFSFGVDNFAEIVRALIRRAERAAPESQVGFELDVRGTSLRDQTKRAAKHNLDGYPQIQLLC